MSDRQPDSYDFQDIETALRNFLSTRPDFKDVNWKGSTASILVDLLSYNTSINASNVGFALGESSLNSSTIRRTAAAKASGFLNYLPASKRCAELWVNLTIPAREIDPDVSIAFDREIRFTGVSDGVTLNFVADQTYSAPLIDGAYTFEKVRLIQGERVTNRFVAKSDLSIESYVIPNQNIDTNTLKVMVKEGDTFVPYERYTHPRQISKDARLYYIRINPYGEYVIEFGDGTFSRQLKYNEVIILDYVATAGLEGNGAARVSPSGSISGYTNIQVVLESPYSSGGSNEESIESIKRLAPMGFGMSGACVSTLDFERAAKSILGDSYSVAAWGGEEHSTPKYGYVFIAVKPSDADQLDDSQKDYLKQSLQGMCLGQITPIITDATYVHLATTIRFDYGKNKTVLNQSQIERKVRDQVVAFSQANLEKFKTDFSHSELNEYTRKIDPSITVASAEIEFYRKDSTIEANFYYNGAHDFNFNIVKGSVKVTGFKPYEQDNDQFEYQLQEVDGRLVMMKQNIFTGSEILFPGDYGYVDHASGVVYVQNLLPDVITDFRIYASKDALDKSISSKQGTIFAIDVVDVKGEGK